MKESGDRVLTGKPGDRVLSGDLGGRGISRRSFVKAGMASLATLYGLGAGGSRLLRRKATVPT